MKSLMAGSNWLSNFTYPVVFYLAKLALIYLYDDRVSIRVQSAHRCAMLDHNATIHFSEESVQVAGAFF